MRAHLAQASSQVRAACNVDPNGGCEAPTCLPHYRPKPTPQPKPKEG